MSRGVGPNPRECHECPQRASSAVCRAAEPDPPAFQELLHRFLYQPRQIVFYEGHESLGIYVLCSGKVKLTSSSKRGHQRNVSIVGAGELIERSGFCEAMVHAVTCETLEPSQICFIERKPYLELLLKNPPQAIELLQIVSGEDQREKNALGRLPFCKSDERLAAVLLDLGARFGKQESEGVQLEIQLTREELAELAGVAPETLIRLLSRFKKERLVATSGREITLLNSERLTKIADPLS